MARSVTELRLAEARTREPDIEIHARLAWHACLHHRPRADDFDHGAHAPVAQNSPIRRTISAQTNTDRMLIAIASESLIVWASFVTMKTAR